MNEKHTNYFVIIFIVIIIALIGSFITSKNMSSWYFTNSVNRSCYSPPSYMFGIAWTILYILYAWAWCIAYNKSGKKYYGIFIISILLNLMWTVAFFGLHDQKLSRAIILILLVVVLYQAYIMQKIGSGLGEAFMLFYALWLVCATSLNFTTEILCK